MPEMALTPAPAAVAGRALRAARLAAGIVAALLLAAGGPTAAAPPPAADPGQAAAAAGSQPAAQPPPTLNQQDLEQFKKAAAAAGGSQPAAQPPPTLDQQNLEQFKKSAEAAGATVQKVMPTPASPAESAPDTRGLDQQIQGLKKDVVDLNKDLFILEEELLFPSNTQVAVFLSVDVGDFFALDAVQLKIDQKEVINYLYTPREVEALLKGGVQRLYIGNLKVGQHELVAFFSGKGPSERAYKRGASIRFEKGVGAKYLELKINDRQRKLQPEFEIKDWD
ncbi:MAG TPA: hypothetical protein VEC10_04720 [Steroidobacteraceae bacterium]|nr:hypothetical protein [Steroidobacteraceae bacterium]